MNETLAAQDQAKWSSAKANSAELLLHASKKSGRGNFELAWESMKLHKLPGKLSLPEYVQYGVYLQPPEAQRRFISNLLHWPITHAVCDMTWQATTEDKWLCSHILSQIDVPVPRTLAVIDRSDRYYPGTIKISTGDDLKAFALSDSAIPFFAKENRGICSFGAFMAEDADADGLHIAGHSHISYARVIDELVQDTPYLIQPLVENHSAVAAHTSHLATVRVCVLAADHGVEIPFTVLKLPGNNNISDSFWRPGNLACGVDPKTGTVETARTKSVFGTEDHEMSPQSRGPLVGAALPFWDELVTLTKQVAKIFAPVRYQSMDIALTEEGPVVIEVNTGGGFDLPQLATGQGFLTDSVCEFFKKYGQQTL